MTLDSAATQPTDRRRFFGRFGTVRLRTTLAAMLVVAIALAVGGWILIAVLRKSLTNDLTSAASLRAHDVARLIESGQAPTSLRLDSTDSSIVQVVDADGIVVAAGHELDDDDPPIVSHRLPHAITIGHLDSEEHPFRVVTANAKGPTGEVLVVAAQSLEPVADSVDQVTRLLVDGLPVVVLLVGAISWFVTGRALRPVELMRTRAEAISEAELDLRMPVPESDDEITRLAQTLNGMLSRLQESRDAQRQFLADASHELRSPLATILYRLELAREHPETVTSDRLVDDLGPEAERMRDLVQSLLDLARADASRGGHRGSAAGIVDVDDLVLREAKRLRVMGSVSVDASEVGAGRVTGDEGALGRVVRNLADNAARHALSTVFFALRTDTNSVVLTVSDDGLGVPGEDRERVFERFVRLDEARARNVGGAGLGLAIVKSVVLAHGGKVFVRDRPGGGAQFVVTLPMDNGVSQ